MGNAAHKEKINGFDLMDWFVLGSEEVKAHKKHLNEINVFPVADGDTGTNLTSTLRAMAELPRKKEAFHEMMEEISDAGMANARGNSGIIFASYVNGLAAEAAGYREVDRQEFSRIASGAVKYLYRAVENPVKGTMITVISDWAEFLSAHHDQYKSFEDFFSAAFHAAGESLQRTKSQMEILRKNNIVDSGAEGFVRFLQGITRFFQGGAITRAEQIPEDDYQLHEEEITEKRYCSEWYLELKEGIWQEDSADRLKMKLKVWGDSIIVMSRGNRLKVHLHTDNPHLVTEELLTLGHVLSQKMDDMGLETRVLSKGKGGLGILTDYIADIPEEYKIQHLVHTIPVGIQMDEEAYLDKQTINLEQLFRYIPRVQIYPTSFQPEPARIKAMLEKLQELYDSLLIISVSSKLSGTWQALEAEAKSMREKGYPVRVVDSRLNSGAQGLIVKRAAELREAGMNLEEIAAKLEEWISKGRIYVCLETIEYAVKGGRVSSTVGAIGMKVGLRPIMSLDESGAGKTFGAAFSRKGITGKILKIIRKTMENGGIEAYSIVHARDPALAEEYRERLSRMIGKEPEFVTEISSVVAINSGIGAVAVSIIEK